MNQIRKIAGLTISRVDAPAHSRDLLPDLEPPEERLRREKTQIFSSDSINLSHDPFSPMDDTQQEWEEHHDFTARLTVYVLNAIVMIFAMPVGAALLFLNIVGGENLRTTSHVLALTGMFLGLSFAGFDMPSLPIAI